MTDFMTIPTLLWQAGSALTLTVDLWSLLIIISIAQGVFVLSMVLVKKQWYRPPHVFLTSLIFVLIWLQAEFYSIRSPFDLGANFFYGTRHGSWMLLGPLYFLYLKTILQPQRGMQRKDWLHFLPFLLVGFILPIGTNGVVNSQQVTYGMLSPLYTNRPGTTWLNYLYTGVFIFQFIHLAAYLLAGSNLIKQYKASFLGVNSRMNSSILWLQRLNIALLGVLIFATVFLIIFFFTDIYRRHLDYLYVLPMAIVLYIIAFRLMKVQLPETSFTTQTNGKKYEKSSLTKKQAKTYARRIMSYLEIEKPYLQNDLRLSDLATALDIPPHHLSQVINEEMDTRFFDLINQFRVAAAKKLIQAAPDVSLLQIAHEAGFNNKTSFVNAFKKHAGHTPSAYRKRIIAQN